MQAVRTGTVVQRIGVRGYGTEGWKALDFGANIEVILETPEDCDEVIRAAIDAKTAMLAKGGECSSVHPGTGEQCTVRRPGHRWHYGPDRGAGVRTMWDDDAGAAAVLAASIDAGTPVITDDEAPTQAEVDRCGYSEDPFHRCRVCYDYAAGRDRERPVKAHHPEDPEPDPHAARASLRMVGEGITGLHWDHLGSWGDAS